MIVPTHVGPKNMWSALLSGVITMMMMVNNNNIITAYDSDYDDEVVCFYGLCWICMNRLRCTERNDVISVCKR